MARKSLVSNLHRFSRLNDKSDTQVFTFIVPTQLTRGFVNEVYSENFLYRNQTWVVKFDRKERHIGAYLILRSTQNQLCCLIDYTFVVQNRDHFTKNESFSESNVEFSLKKLCRGRPSFIEVSDLEQRHFLFDDGKFLIELELRNCATLFNDQINISKIDSTNGTIESNYFNFGGCDWSIMLRFTAPSNNIYPLPEFSLVRHSHFEHYSKVGYRITLLIPEWPELSATVEQQLDIKGYGSFFRLKTDKTIQSAPRDVLSVSLKLYSMRQLSIVDLIPTNRQKNAVRCYDLNQHDWMIQSDILGSVVKLRFFYMQVANVPKGQTHLVCWDCQILPNEPKLKVVKSVNGPYCAYFSQKESDEGTELATNLIVEQVCDTKAGYVNPENGVLSVQIEWLQSHLLTYDQYHIYDNVSRTHKTQMSKEIKTLQSENYALEKQLYKYQQSLAVKKLSLKDDEISTSSGPTSGLLPSASIMTGGAVPPGMEDTVSLGGVSCPPDYGPPRTNSPRLHKTSAGATRSHQPQNSPGYQHHQERQQYYQQQQQHQQQQYRSLSPGAVPLASSKHPSSNRYNPPPPPTQRTPVTESSPYYNLPPPVSSSSTTHSNTQRSSVLTSPTPQTPSNINSTNEIMYDGSGVVKRQLPRNPNDDGNHPPGSYAPSPSHHSSRSRGTSQDYHRYVTSPTAGVVHGNGSHGSQSGRLPRKSPEPTQPHMIIDNQQQQQLQQMYNSNNLSNRSSKPRTPSSSSSSSRTHRNLPPQTNPQPVANNSNMYYNNNTHEMATGNVGLYDDYDSPLALRYENRVSTQKKW